ncbi:MAG TPA: aldose 1-epimerase [Capillimicrobium sp.]|nr:aldose 1-epimerase [Capillimicrobium sp.]
MSTPVAASVRLRRGPLELDAAADGFLAVTSLRHAGRELLVGPDELPPAATVHGTSAGITLLHPWANRVGADRFATAGRDVRLDPADPAVGRDVNGLPIHGLAAPAGAWHLRVADGVLAATLTHTGEEGGAFPFPHRLDVELALHDRGLRVVTTLHATGRVPVPVAFGWHPYLRLPGVARHAWVLELPERERLVADAWGLPSGPTVAEAAEAAPLGARRLDVGYGGLAPGAVMALRGGGWRLAVSLDEGYPAAQAFAPTEADVVSLEPMTAITDALRSGRGLPLVAPGGAFRAVFALAIAGPPAAAMVGRR